MVKKTMRLLITLLLVGMGWGYGYGQSGQTEPSTAYDQQNWALVVMEKGQDKPAVKLYHSLAEKGLNDVEYNRIFDGAAENSYLFRQGQQQPVKTQYGYRWAGKQMFIYDFESQKESLAFDFNLAIGDRFTTYNGVEWVVESVKDTLVNMTFCKKGELVSKRLLTVKTLDGSRHDQWLEGFGSFSNFFMIGDLGEVASSHALWWEYRVGEYLAREINADPIYTHDSGWLDGTGNPESKLTPHTACTYSQGGLTFENVQWFYAHRDYTCFYRDGDHIEELYGWEMQPQVDTGTAALDRDAFTLRGLPEPASGKYTIRLGNAEYTTGIKDVRTVASHSGYTYDLQGRRTEPKSASCIQIREGKKVLVK